MRILIVEPGLPPAPLESFKGFYPAMFRRLLSNVISDCDYEVCSIVSGDVLPQNVKSQYDGVVILGSPLSVYDDVPWIDELCGFVRDNASESLPQIGICFGHQLIAKAMGGYVAKAPQGWGIGRHTYDVNAESIANLPVALEGNKNAFNLLVSHQDQVLEKPKMAQLVAGSEFTPNAILHYSEERILSCQGHPEFTSDFAKELITSRRGISFDEAFVDNAIKDIDKPVDGALMAKMFAALMTD